MFAVKSYKHQTLPFSFLVVFADGGAYYRATDLQRAFQVTNISRPLASCRGETVRFRMLRDRYAIPAAAYSGVIGTEASLLTLAGLKTFANYGTLSLSPVYKWVTEELPRLVEADMGKYPNVPDSIPPNSSRRTARVQLLEEKLENQADVLRQVLLMLDAVEKRLDMLERRMQ